METVIEWILQLLGIYLTIGLLFAIPIAFRGARKIDPSAVEGTWGFTLLIIPGSMIRWPLLMHRWLRAVPQPEEESGSIQSRTRQEPRWHQRPPGHMSEECFIGWQGKAPEKTGKFLKALSITCVLVAVGMLAALPALQKTVSQEAVFDYGNVQEFSGIMVEDPVPMLVGDEVVPETIARTTGAGASAKHPIGAYLELGETTLKGEIVDSKCYLGVMNPGNLKAHRACAINCIQGGVPPVLLVRDGGGASAMSCW